MNELSLYIHIPFCKSKCLYCDFVSFDTNIEIPKYVKYLNREIELLANKYKDTVIKTVFFGGGTPTLLNPVQLKEVVVTLKENFMLNATNIEITMEANPETVDFKYLEAIRTIGINRISFGLQTTSDELLKSIGRIHTYDTFKNAFSDARKAGFDNISIDLMFGLPGQTLEVLESTLEDVIKLNPEHISAYALKYEKGTKLFDMLDKGKIDEIGDELDRDMNGLIRTRLQEAGLKQYEISNYAKTGRRSKHNLAYWHNESFLGLGLNSSYYMDMCRIKNIYDLESYYGLIDQDMLPIEEDEKNSVADELFETIFLNLRLNDGLDIEAINQKYNIDFLDKYQDTLQNLKLRHLIEVKKNHLKLTTLGQDLSNSVFIEFM